ncbi:MAG: serine hydrolase domain-containing protein, partial [Anaerolineales bacterium]
MKTKSSSSNSNFNVISTRIQKEMKRLHVPGVAIGIYHKGKEWTEGFGVTSVENPLPVNSDTLMQVGSISKTFTATLLMMLTEQGKVNLDAPVRKYLKDFKLKDESVAKKVTIRHLLTHTGGWVG